MSTPNFTVHMSGKVADEIRQLLAPGSPDGDEMLRDFKTAVAKMQDNPLAFGEAREKLAALGLRTRLAFEGLLVIRFAVHAESKRVWLQTVRDRRKKRGQA